MAKFDEEEWKKRMAQEVADEEATKAQNERDGKMDKAFEEEFAQLFGYNADTLRKLLDQAVPEQTKAEREESLRYMKNARKAWRAGDKKRAEKLIMGNHGIREVKRKSGKGCAVIALALVGGVGTMIYGLAEVAGHLFG